MTKEDSTEDERWARVGAISMRPATGSAFCHVEPRLGPANPLSDPPLRITLHGPSLVDANIELVDCLRDLHSLEMVDVLCTWGGRWPNTSIADPSCASIEESALDLLASDSAPRWWSGSGWSATTGRLREWEHVRQRVRDRSLDERASKGLLDAYAAAAVHVARGRHLFVCHDRRLLAERDERYWNGVRVVDLSEAVALAGAVLREHDELPAHGVEERAAGFRNRLSTLAALWHLIDSVGIHDIDGVQISGVSKALEDRTLQLIHARDAVTGAVFGRQDYSTGIPAVHALSGLILAAHSLFEAWAVMADAFLALGIAGSGAHPAPAIVRKQTAKVHPRVHAALTADRLLKLQHLLATLRHPLAHSGTIATRSSGTLATPMRLSVGLSSQQDAALEAAAKVRGQSVKLWGALDGGCFDPWRLAHRVALETLGELPVLIEVLALELGHEIRLVGRRPDFLNYYDVLETCLLGGIGESEQLMALEGLEFYPSVV